MRNFGATKRVRKAPILTVKQSGVLLKKLREPFATIALVSISLGLRINRTLVLRLAAIDFLQFQTTINRGIVMQQVDACKTRGTAKTFALASELMGELVA